ncbi:MAG: DNA-binding transcriptional MerR regulator, partial [Candidatus Azotimanducaceae bacterium]
MNKLTKSETKPEARRISVQGLSKKPPIVRVYERGSIMNTGYRIGAVAKLTGISTDTIRAWERRYSVVEPNRGENNNRYYTDGHIKKLISVKRLVDAGQAIGTICRLSEPELTERTSGLLGIDRQFRIGQSSDWAIVSVQQPGWLKACVASQPDNDVTWLSGLGDLKVADYAFTVIDMPSLSEVNEQEIIRHVPLECSSNCLIVYRFASRNQLRSLASRGFKLLKGPLEPFALANLLAADGQAVAAAQPRQFSQLQLNKLSDLNSPVACECPKHLAELITALNQFEDYSNDCMTQSVEEADLHRRLFEMTSQARAIMEQALSE